MATGTRYRNKQDLLDAIERVKFNLNFETSSDKIQNNDKDIVESLWPLLKFEVFEITGKVFRMICTKGSANITMAADPADIAEINIGDPIALAGSSKLLFPHGTTVIGKDVSNPNPTLHFITVSNPANFDFTGLLMTGLAATHIRNIDPSGNEKGIFDLPNVEGVFINLEEFSGMDTVIVEDITVVRFADPLEEYDGKRLTIFANNRINVWGPSNSLVGRIAQNWYFLVNAGPEYMTASDAGAMLWYKDRWWINA